MALYEIYQHMMVNLKPHKGRIFLNIGFKPFSSFKELFIKNVASDLVCVCFASTYACVLYVCLVSVEVRRCCWITETGVMGG